MAKALAFLQKTVLFLFQILICGRHSGLGFVEVVFSIASFISVADAAEKQLVLSSVLVDSNQD